jgi:hypothetical protein
MDQRLSALIDDVDSPPGVVTPAGRVDTAVTCGK